MTGRSKTRAFDGWALTVGAGLFALGGSALIIALQGAGIEGTSAVLRFTARTSYALYLAAFVAAPLAALSASPIFRRLRANRRYLGVGFAASHTVHLAAIIRFGSLQPGLYDAVTLALGGLGFVFLAAMTTTSFNRTTRMLGPRAWKALHKTGMYYLGIIFVATAAGNIAARPAYLIYPASFLAVWALRLYIALRVRPAAGARAGMAG